MSQQPEVVPDYTPVLEALGERERVVVEARLKGMSVHQAAAAAGITYANVRSLIEEPQVKAAIKRGKEISAAAMHMTRERLTEMLFEAYRAAGCAAEMVMACNALAKLHGLNAPQQLQIDHSHRVAMVKSEELKSLPLAELERLAHTNGQDVIEGEFVPVRMLEHANGT